MTEQTVITRKEVDRIVKKSGLSRKEWYSRIYLRSDHWKNLRQEKYWQVGRKCEKCAVVDKLEVHHLNYRNIYDVTIHDLQVLCPDHHDEAHGRKPKKKKRNPTPNKKKVKPKSTPVAELMRNVKIATRNLHRAKRRLNHHVIPRREAVLKRAEAALSSFLNNQQATPNQNTP